MAMNTYLVGIRPPDERWQRMKAVYDACATAGLEPPREVRAFFNDIPPDSNGVTINLSIDGDAVQEWRNDHAEGLQVDLTKLPEGLVYLRFVNSW